MNNSDHFSVQTTSGTFHGLNRGHGPAVLLVHGFPLDHRMWRHQIAALESDYQLIAPDLLGFGRSQTARRDMSSMTGFAEQLAELLDTLGIDRVVFCGLSMGGYIGFGILAPARGSFTGADSMRHARCE